MLAMGEYKPLYTQVLWSARVASLGVKAGSANIIYTIKWPLVLLGMTLRAGHNHICVHQILGVSWNTRLWNLNLRHVYGMIRYLQELECTFHEISFQTKGSIWRKSYVEIVYFTFFSKGFYPNTFRDIIIKGFNWIITKWRKQCHSCSLAIQHKSPLNIQYNKHTTTKCIIFTTSPDHIN